MIYSPDDLKTRGYNWDNQPMDIYGVSFKVARYIYNVLDKPIYRIDFDNNTESMLEPGFAFSKSNNPFQDIFAVEEADLPLHTFLSQLSIKQLQQVFADDITYTNDISQK